MRDADFIGLVAVVMLFGVPISAIVGHFLYEAWKAWLEIGLKRDMVARGYTAQEIVDVLSTNAESTKSSLASVPPAKPIQQPVYNP